MSSTVSRPDWVSDELYPFTSRFFHTPAGNLHYIDEGRGPVFVFIHGNPSWSFEFRNVIKYLRREYRCIAVDHLGFGLSDKTFPEIESHPQRHAERLRALLDYLEVDDVILVMGDWGAPIGIDFAVTRPDKVKGLVITNSLAWPVNGDLHFEMFSRLMSSFIGQFMIRRFNFLINKVVPAAVGVKFALTADVMKHYRGPMLTVSDRAGSADMPRYILEAKEWLADIWSQREKFANKPAIIVWGGADIAYRQKELDIWKSALVDVSTHYYKKVGHMPAEEIPGSVAEHLRAFVSSIGLGMDAVREPVHH